ncbi:hypothetical protein [Stenotrophomonas sp. 22385]|jgi:hypothetical protein|uniref:hypothetical protein n=1 Tax=Stenotrophomonas sp. 22385 TaxID=3453915 RepID=UPI003F82FDF0
MPAISDGTVIAVLTGDIVNSTRMDAGVLSDVRHLLTHATRKASSWSRSGLAGPEFYRGDAWQLAVGNPCHFLRMAIWLKAHLAASDLNAQTRIAIGLGAFEVLHDRAVSLSTGEAFIRSGHALEEMGKRKGMLLAASGRLSRMPWLPAQVTVCDFIASRWTRGQAEVAISLLSPDAPSQIEAAKNLNKPQQSVSRVYRDAGLYALLEVLELVEKSIDESLHDKTNNLI